MFQTVPRRGFIVAQDSLYQVLNMWTMFSCSIFLTDGVIWIAEEEFKILIDNR